ncbi:MAG: hypothetical protein RIF41_32765 [Polyangiaceae bacterium]
MYPSVTIAAIVLVTPAVGAMAGCSDSFTSAEVGPDSTAVGATCDTDDDCEQMCVNGDDFGAGMCTGPCANDDECPSLSACAQVEEGLCAVTCSSHAACEGFPDGFGCHEKDRVGGGAARVCRIP